ncbi:unnamed protein product [Adineta ricciae]|uniref:Uncharacterized protein n=1 Tax=Adineta ricciae TaxID=249248 RepID=A0A813WHC0_ADIRI|nr:unnamed protein product [Adineta ricciae]CAF0861366.1 unnamed protein product [Adineta ricciae]
MASMASNLQKILRQHIPMIQFRYGANRSGSATHATKENVKDSSSVVNKAGATSPTKTVQQAGTFEFVQTPAKYRRRSLTQEEIDLVAIGGSV